MKNKLIILGILALLVSGFVLAGCLTGCLTSCSNNVPDITWTVKQVGGAGTAGNAATADTTSIVITFSDDVADIKVKAGNISLTNLPPGTNVGTMAFSGKTCTIPITAIGGTEYAMVQVVNKDGVVDGTPQNVLLYQSGDTVPKNYTVKVDGIENHVTTTKLTLLFPEDVSGVTAAIPTPAPTDSAAGTASVVMGAGAAGKTWPLNATVTKQGYILLAVTAAGYTAAPKVVSVFKKK